MNSPLLKWQDICKNYQCEFIRYIICTPGKTKHDDFLFHRKFIQIIQRAGLKHAKDLYILKPQKKFHQGKYSLQSSLWILQINQYGSQAYQKLQEILNNTDFELLSQIKFNTNTFRFIKQKISQYYYINLNNQPQRDLLLNLSNFQNMIIFTLTCEDYELIRINQKIAERFSKIHKISHQKYYTAKKIEKQISGTQRNQNTRKVMWIYFFDNWSVQNLYQELIFEQNVIGKINIYYPTTCLLFDCKDQRICNKINNQLADKGEKTEVNKFCQFIILRNPCVQDSIKFIDFLEKNVCIMWFFQIFTNYEIQVFQFIDLNQENEYQNRVLIQYYSKQENMLNSITNQMIYQKGVIMYPQRSLPKNHPQLNQAIFTVFLHPNLLKLYFPTNKKIIQGIHHISKYLKIVSKNGYKNKFEQLLQYLNLEYKIAIVSDCLIVKMRNQIDAIDVYQLNHQEGYRIQFVKQEYFDKNYVQDLVSETQSQDQQYCDR